MWCFPIVRAELMEKFKKLEEENAHMKDQVDAFTVEKVEDLERELDDAKRLGESLQNHYQKCKADLEARVEELRDREETIRERDEEIASLHKLLEERKAEYEEEILKRENFENMQQEELERMDKEIIQAKEEIDSLLKKVEGLLGDIAQLEKDGQTERERSAEAEATIVREMEERKSLLCEAVKEVDFLFLKERDLHHELFLAEEASVKQKRRTDRQEMALKEEVASRERDIRLLELEILEIEGELDQERQRSSENLSMAHAELEQRVHYYNQVAKKAHLRSQAEAFLALSGQRALIKCLEVDVSNLSDSLRGKEEECRLQVEKREAAETCVVVMKKEVEDTLKVRMKEWVFAMFSKNHQALYLLQGILGFFYFDFFFSVSITLFQ